MDAKNVRTTLLERMTEQTEIFAIVFADISGSTSLYEELGDTRAHHQITLCMETLAAVVTGYRGRVVKTNGDDLLSVFTSIEHATLAACGMQEALAEDPRGGQSTQPSKLAVRIGLHAGPVIVEKNDIYGDAVNVAARIVGLAKMGQIITTRYVVEQLSPLLRGSTRLIDHAQLRGKKEGFDLFEVLWRQDDATLMSPDLVLSPAQRGQLLVTYDVHRIVVDPSRPQIVVGRGEAADLRVDEIMASRLHARLEWRRDKFFLVDQSTNGTYLDMGGGEKFVRRDEVVLGAEGRLSLGRPFADNAHSIVHFKSTG